MFSGSHQTEIAVLESQCHLDVSFDQIETRTEHHLQLGRILHTDWFPDPLVLQVSTTSATTPQQTPKVTTDTKRVTERVFLRGHPIVATGPVGTFVRSMGHERTGAGEFKTPMGVVVAQEEVFVTDFTRDRVQVFDLEGQYLRD
jgi:hypothetical protein